MLGTSDQSEVFCGVHFVLFGFSPEDETEVRFKLVNGGAVDEGKYSGSCTHVIVDKIIYDDPVCIAARNDGKTVVTKLWVDHSSDIAMPVDASSVMYRPLKDLNGIPGAQNLVVCLTGYLRQDRDDIMTMVDLIGATFLKPLVANRVTHLVCYKFEGEKYELAKRMGTIKLVNHRWLEDCLKVWALLPEENYNKSGYELEIMKLEAKDSDEETEDFDLGQSERNISRSPLTAKFGVEATSGLLKSDRELSSAQTESTSLKNSPKVDNSKESSFIQGNNNGADRDISFSNVDEPKATDKFLDVAIGATSCQIPETDVKIRESKKANSPKTGCQDVLITEKAEPHAETFNKLANDFGSPSTASAERVTHSEAKFSSIKYYSKNKRGFTLPRSLNDGLDNGAGSTVSPLADLKSGNKHKTPSNKVLNGSGGIKSTSAKDSGDVTIGKLPQKRVNEAASNTLKSRKITSDAKLFIEKITSENGKSEARKVTSVVEEPSKSEPCFSAGKDSFDKPNKNSFSKSIASISNSLSFDEPFTRDTSPKSARSDKAYQTESKINGKHEIAGHGMEQVAGNEVEQHKLAKNLEGSPDNKNPLNGESPNLDLGNEESTKLIKKSPRKKSVAKRSFGSKPKVGATAKQKTLVSSNRTIQQGEAVNFSSRIKEVPIDNGDKPQPMTDDNNKSEEQETVVKHADDANGRLETMDDETEAPDDKCELELGMKHDENKNKADETAEKSEDMHHVTECEAAVPEKETAELTEKEKAPSVDDSTMKREVKHQVKKRPLSIAKKVTVAKGLQKSKVALSENKISMERENVARMKSAKEVSHATDASNKSFAPRKAFGDSKEQKENRPIDEGEQDMPEAKSVANRTNKLSSKPEKINPKQTGYNPPMSEANKRLKTEPPCFILTGHHFLRKDFQQLIKKLKGKVCRDSHQWSYQATHFIAPEPLRRIEKFFAAAASGRWILKTDFLTASNQAGEFVEEEPYEWHDIGLNEDGTIDMEAPRKWRLLKERTGHGAFYGMRIIVYGDCITPPLDTLKRVVKAGDGTILATSPPYTRFLGTGIDYAIVAPGMPRVDLWVQEFLRYEIPCISADYLVEYVCKPSSSLEKHVLYDTHAWAERSFSKHQNRAEETTDIEESISSTPESNDVACEVCGSRDRGDVMLICGDESGSVGCGVGTHIDCCDPPLMDVPEEDWFCSKCIVKRNCSNSPKKRKKGGFSKSKRK
ncbi:hypothetical protein HN51_054400 [Arachis hypogaea]|uniref:BRCT domain-containing protein n=1 Tax=Arachis hypogaea TaxID=3818 RepID=A0A444XHG1_ARAHY|nr:BRCT domain-containing protein At4g02110 isoform X1 [Arachis ipaensis]XP_025676325.1 BRCT domain-containing protein At4g02110 isoform X1 [Arachis hypogaea]QHN76947.1 BRCT domain-containing protein [Arachis hypogaea]RYQ89228.1 hypothetical protein Ahy_B09g095981 isoform B [Arachis hypogaea]